MGVLCLALCTIRGVCCVSCWSWGWLEVEGVVIVVCVVVGDEGCEVFIVVYVEDGDRVE